MYHVIKIKIIKKKIILVSIVKHIQSVSGFDHMTILSGQTYFNTVEE